MFSFSTRSNIMVDSMININATHACKAKTNMDIVDNNFCAL